MPKLWGIPVRLDVNLPRYGIRITDEIMPPFRSIGEILNDPKWSKPRDD